MRTVAFAFLALVSVSAGLLAPSSLRAQSSSTAPAQAATATVTIPVKGMACMACAGKTKQTLRGTPGVSEVEVKLSPGSATVKYDPSKVTPEKLVAVIKELGYEAELPAAKPAE